VRDFLLVLALLLSVFSMAAVGLQPDSSDFDSALAELSAQVRNLQSQNDQLYRLLSLHGADVDALQARIDLQDQDLDALFAWSDQVAALLSPPVGEAGASYDCDDATLDAFRFYTERGYPVCVLAGNLELEGESRYRVDHVWLLVRFEGGWLPVDWGAPAHDAQHFEGYRLTERQLLLEVAADAA